MNDLSADASAYPLDFDSLLSFFERHGLRCLTDEARTELAVPDPKREGWVLRVVPQPERGVVHLVYPLPGAIPEDRVVDLTIAANLLNANTLIGAWVLNPKARELVFKLTVRSQGVLYTDAGLLPLLQLVVGAVEAHVDELDRILKGARPPGVDGA